MASSKKLKLSAAQICGWIVWWIVTIVLIGVAFISYFFGDSQTDSSLFWVVLATFAVLYTIQQILAAIAIRHLHTNNNYVWPIVLIVMAFLGSFVYVIPGIWALIVNNPQRNSPRKSN
ncbi:hypothetical protein LASUN_13760 [Lentilactobacillus sunkii]|jgi:uncharacterized membrane protein YhaH (DUF805 family)|uniref:Uncharacterized protein n=1 Tax=Lentilactobacillus sunkii TaxID=481719 RepID=A0A1E7XCH9_9LACO|nr:hypothetical protein [Lentilactobacillus sunkii]OFA10825.1 hypothetical protein LASUN_13760 [Lentilactobacillus sunkii]